MKGVVSYLFLKWHTFFFNIVTYDEQIFSPFRSIVRIFYYNTCSLIFSFVYCENRVRERDEAS